MVSAEKEQIYRILQVIKEKKIVCIMNVGGLYQMQSSRCRMKNF